VRGDLNVKVCCTKNCFQCGDTIQPLLSKGVSRKISREANGKTRPKNSTIKPLSTLSVPCTKIQREPRPPLLPMPVLLRDVGVEELHGGPTVGLHPKICIRDQK